MSEDERVTDALEVLGNEIRMDIVRELAEADEPLSFTELRERVGLRDSGQFNYHLTRLCSYFVRDTGDGYELGHAGTRLVATAGVAEASTGNGDSSATTGTSSPTADGAEDGLVDVCPVCGEDDCGKLFHVHLTPPWRSSSR